ncbi:DUF1254 domain-containing protein [Gordonia iterans]
MTSIDKAIDKLTTDDIRAIAKDAYIYGFPMVDMYRILHSYVIDTGNPQYKGGWNQMHSIARVFTPADTTVQTPNSDTPYTFLVADLRAEPLVITVPPIDGDRYFSAQFIDAYTYVFALLGTRTTGNGGGTYLLAGPGWDGERPPGIDAVLECATSYAMVLFRTQLFEPDDLPAVVAIQESYGAMTLSEFAGTEAPPAVPALDFYPPLTAEAERTSLDFFSVLCFVLGQAPVLPGEEDVRARFARLGVDAGGDFDARALDLDRQTAVAGGIADAWKDVETNVMRRLLTGEISSGDVFGSRAELGDDYLRRMAGTILGILGLPGVEALYFPVKHDSDGEALTGANDYTLTFAADGLPPVDAFWSVTMYRLPEILLIDNPIDRYLINSPMLDDFVRNEDGSLTFYLQHTSPGAELEANWLPTPAGDFEYYLRTYCPGPAVVDGSWRPPRPVKTSR